MRLFPNTLSYLDLGCSNGGLVFDFLSHGNTACGLEGSDWPSKNKSGFWGILPSNLFTADITKPFQLVDSDVPYCFDVIGAWEVLEHIHEQDLAALFSNIHKHLKPSGIFMASVAQFPDFNPETGDCWHVTIQPKIWWVDKFKLFGFKEIAPPADFVYPRGFGNPTTFDWDVRKNPNDGFHVFLKKIAE